jgi:hypothetical protein
VLYAVYTKVFILTHKNCVISSENKESRVLNLPPTEELPLHYTSCEKLYFSGWLFRNHKGIAKFETELREIFTPHKAILERVHSIVSPLREKYTKIIGVHIRQSDYKDFKGGIFIIPQSRIRTILDEYIKNWSLDIEKTVFLIASDGPIDTEKFSNLNISISKENSVTDLFLLSKTDSILGSDSSFGAFSSWYGNIPHILFKNEAIEWDYYKDKSEFFTNKHSVLNRY